MSSASPLAVPLPFLTALLACMLAARLATAAAGNRTGRLLFAGLFLVFALQATLVGLRFGYGIEEVLRLQRILPFAVGPLSLLGFSAFALPADQLRGRLFLHVALALAAMAAFLVFPPALAWIDPAIALSFIVYIAFLARLYRLGPDGLEATPIPEVRAIRIWLLGAILLLLLILVMDALIALDFALAAGARAPELIALGSLLLIPIFIITALLLPQRTVDQTGFSRSSAGEGGAQDGDRELLERMEKLLGETALFRDPDLTLARLARRLGVPARRLSQAVNRVEGRNLSQLVNDRRIAEAARQLSATSRSLADIMAASGFRSRSNFYREFQRVQGMTPAEHRRRGAGQGPAQASS